MLVCGLLLRAVAARPENSRASEAPGAWPVRMLFALSGLSILDSAAITPRVVCITKARCTKLNASNDETKGPYLRCGAELGWRPFGSEGDCSKLEYATEKNITTACKGSLRCFTASNPA